MVGQGDGSSGQDGFAVPTSGAPTAPIGLEQPPAHELPGPPTMAQVLASIEQNRQVHTLLLQQLVQNTNNNNNNHPSPSPEGRSRTKLEDFHRTRPPSFSAPVEPLDANDWLREVEGKLDVAQCNDAEKMLYAPSQLKGAAMDWWIGYKAMVPVGQESIWRQFKEEFRKAFIPGGLMEAKEDEFRALTQGNLSVMEFYRRFNALLRYAGNEFSNEARKVKWFRDRLNPELQWALSTNDIPDFKSLIDKELRAERTSIKMKQDNKRKWVEQKAARGSSSRPRYEPRPQTGWRPPAQAPHRQQAPTTQAQSQVFQSGNRGAQQLGNQNFDARGPCYNCGKHGHYSYKCTAPY